VTVSEREDAGGVFLELKEVGIELGAADGGDVSHEDVVYFELVGSAKIDGESYFAIVK
jgi:hypothetical protein